MKFSEKSTKSTRYCTWRPITGTAACVANAVRIKDTIEPILFSDAHTVVAPIFILFAFVKFKLITIFFVQAVHTLLLSITDVSPVQTQQTIIAFKCRITDNPAIFLNAEPRAVFLLKLCVNGLFK